MKKKLFATTLLALVFPAVGINAGLEISHNHSNFTESCAASHENHNGITFQEWTDSTSLPMEGRWYLTRDVTISECRFVSGGASLQLCLNGHSITMNGTTMDDAFRVRKDCRLSIYNCDDSVTHKYSIDETGLATVDDSLTENYETFTGGYITTLGNGNAIRLKGDRARAYLYGGTLIGCKSDEGAGIVAPSGSGEWEKIYLYGGNIIGNVATNQYAGVMAAGANCELHINGNPKIFNNRTTSNNAAGVYANSTTTIAGSPKIYGNTNGSGQAMNFSATGGQSDVSCDGELGSGADIHIANNSLKNNLLKNYYTYNSEAPSTYFKADVGVLSWAKDGENAVMTQKYVVTYESNGGSAVSPLSEGVNALPNPLPTTTKEHWNFGGWYKDSSFKSEATAGESLSDDVTLYAKWVLPQSIANVIDKIDEIGTVVYPGSGDKINAARTAYNALTSDEKALVSNYSTLTDAETEYEAIKVAGVSYAKNLINVIGEVALDKGDEISAARTAYNALTTEQKALVDNYKTLTDAEAQYEALVVGGANNVKDLIDAIGTVAYPDSGDQISAARTGYDGLIEEQKALVDNYKTLTDAEEQYEALKVAGADNVKDLIDAIGTVAYPDSGDQISGARTAYDALTLDQKALVDNYGVLTDAEVQYEAIKVAGVNDVKTLISAIGEVTLENADAIIAARTAYDNLTEEQKALVDNYEVLVAAEGDYNDLLLANAVEEQISAIGEVAATEECKGKIDAARAAYDVLSDDQKALVTNYAALTAAEKSYADIVAANGVKSLIADIGTVAYTSQCKTKIDAARLAYDALTEDQQSLVDNADELTVAEKAYADMDAAHNVETLIATIGEVSFTKESKDKIDDARAAYDVLTDNQKSLVSNYQVLVDAETTYASLKNNHEKAAEVETLISGIDEVTLEKEPVIVGARAAYTELTEAQKALVSEEALNTLTQKEAELKALKDAAMAGAVKTLIGAIGEVEYTGTSHSKIMAARTAYDSLTSEQKALVDNYEVLTVAETQYEALKIAGVNSVKALIDGIGTVAYPDSGDQISAARAAYDSLSDEQQTLVTNYALLTKAEGDYADLGAAHEVEVLIDTIGEVAFTEESKTKIDAARAAYDALTSEQKALVDNYKTLTDAEARYAELEEQSHRYTVESKATGVTIQTKDATPIPVNIDIKAVAKDDVSAAKDSEWYKQIQAKLSTNQVISKVFDVKLVKTVGELQTEVALSDIKEGLVIKISIAIPDGMDLAGLKILHIHSQTDIEYIENFTIESNKLNFEVSKLSEFAFVTTKAAPAPSPSNSGVPGWVIALIIVGGVLVLACLAYALLFFVFNKWTRIDDKVARVVKLGKKGDKVKVLLMPFKVAYIEENQIFDKKVDIK